MKKIAIFAFALSLFSQVKAEDNLQLIPVQASAGASGSSARFDVQMFKDSYDNVSQLQFDLTLPEGMTLKSAAATKGILPSYIDYDDDDNEVTKYYHTFTCVNIEGNLWRITATTTTAGQKFKAGNGIVARIRYELPSDMASGVYPIKISHVEFSGTDGVSKEMSSSVSYIKVGEPSNASLVLEGQLPSLVNTALASETAISTLNLSAVTEVNGDFTYVDGRAVTAPAAEFEVSAKYAKTVTEGKYASLTLPFDATFGDETAYKFTEVEGDYAKFDAVNSAQAGDVVLLTKSVNLTGSKLSTVAGATADKAYYVSQDGSELRQGTNVNVPALRGVWEIEGAGSNLRIMLDGIATDIKMSDLVGEGAQAFDLQGRRTANAKNGVYVVNGKKQIVK